MKNSTWTGLHLGIEFNVEMEDNAPSMDKQMERWLKDKTCNNPYYFTILTAQVECFGGPESPTKFFYDDVSQVPGNGRLNNREVYARNVAASVKLLLKRIAAVKPTIILIAGAMAFAEFRKQVLPEMSKLKGMPSPIHIVRVRNPSPQGHIGLTRAAWLERYAAIQGRAELERQAKTRAKSASTASVMLWRMAASKKNHHTFSLTSLS